jgi:hypothetical protein
VTAVPHWQARYFALDIPGATPVVHILVASLQENVVRMALADELRARGDMILSASAHPSMAENRTYLVDQYKAYESSARAVELGVDAIELFEQRYELKQVTEHMATPTE